MTTAQEPAPKGSTSKKRTYLTRIKSRLKAPKFGLPRSSNYATITDLLLQQIDFSLAAADLAIEVCNRTSTAKVSRAAMREVEHQGDFAKAALLDRIALALTTPLDREDLLRASRAIDDVLDTLRDLVREMDMWKVKPGKWSRGSLAPARLSLQSLRSVVANPESERAKIRCLRARKEAGQLRRAYQDGLTGVFSDELTMDTLKKREILRRIDVVGLRLTEAADAVLDGLVKRSL